MSELDIMVHFVTKLRGACHEVHAVYDAIAQVCDQRIR